MSGIRKAALLLASLDPRAAAELVKTARPDLVTEITAELVLLDATGARDVPTADFLREFFTMLGSRRQARERPDSFIRQMLEAALGKQKSEEVFGHARRLVDVRDPFMQIRPMDVQSIARALAGQHPQVATLVLLELPPAKSAALVPLLDEKVRTEAVRRMTVGDTVSPEAKVRVAAMIRERLESLRKADAGRGPAAVVAEAAGASAADPLAKARTQAHLRRVSLLLRGLTTELRDNLVKAITEHNAETGQAVQNLMVLWEDLPIMADRNMQEVLRSVDSRKTALALIGADGQATAKIRSNISERARAMIDEETQLMKKPKPEDIESAREEVLVSLRQLNATGELQFEGK